MSFISVFTVFNDSQTVTFQCPFGVSQTDFLKQLASSVNVDVDVMSNSVEWDYPKNFNDPTVFEGCIKESAKNQNLVVVFHTTLPKVAFVGVENLNTFPPAKEYLRVPCGVKDLQDPHKYKAVVLTSESVVTTKIDFITIPKFIVHKSIVHNTTVGEIEQFCLKHTTLPKVAFVGMENINSFPPAKGYRRVLCDSEDLQDPQFNSEYKAVVLTSEAVRTVSLKQLPILQLIVSDTTIGYVEQFCEKVAALSVNLTHLDGTISAAPSVPKVAIFGIESLVLFPLVKEYVRVLCEAKDLDDPQFCSKYQAAVWIKPSLQVCEKIVGITIPKLVICEQDPAQIDEFCCRYFQCPPSIQLPKVAIFGLKNLDSFPPAKEYVRVLCDDKELQDPNLGLKYQAAVWVIESHCVPHIFNDVKIPKIVVAKSNPYYIEWVGRFCQQHLLCKTNEAVVVPKSEAKSTEQVLTTEMLISKKEVVLIEITKSVPNHQINLRNSISVLQVNPFYLSELDLNGVQKLFEPYQRLMFLVDNINPCIPECFSRINKPRLVVDSKLCPSTNFHNILTSFVDASPQHVALIGTTDACLQFRKNPIINKFPNVSFLPLDSGDYLGYRKLENPAIQGVVHITKGDTETLSIKNVKNLPILKLELTFDYHRTLDWFCNTMILKQSIDTPPKDFKVNIFGSKKLYDNLITALQDMQFDVELKFCNRLSEAHGKVLYLDSGIEKKKWWFEKLKATASAFEEVMFLEDDDVALIRSFFTETIKKLARSELIRTAQEKYPAVEEEIVEPVPSFVVGDRVIYNPGNTDSILKQVEFVCHDGNLVLRDRGDLTQPPQFAKPSDCIRIVGDIEDNLRRQFVGKLAFYWAEHIHNVMVVTGVNYIGSEVQFMVRCPNTQAVRTVKAKSLKFKPENMRVKCRCCRAISVRAWTDGGICTKCVNFETKLQHFHPDFLRGGLVKVFRNYATYLSDDGQLLFDRQDAIRYFHYMVPGSTNVEQDSLQFSERLGGSIDEKSFVGFYFRCIETHNDSVVKDFQKLDFFKKYCPEATLCEFSRFDMVVTKDGYFGSVQKLDEETVEIVCFGNPDVIVKASPKDVVHFAPRITNSGSVSVHRSSDIQQKHKTQRKQHPESKEEFMGFSSREELRAEVQRIGVPSWVGELVGC